MPNISQIEVNNITYDICDPTVNKTLSNISDWFICDGEPSYGPETGTLDNPRSSISSEHARLYTEKYSGSPCFATKHATNSKSYIFNLWGDTGSLRLDSYDHTNGERKILGYVPLSNQATNKCVEIISNASLITPASGWTVNSCQIARWGQIVQLYFSMKYNAAISVGASGNITNITIGTLNSQYCPTDFMAYMWAGDDNHAWGAINTNGSIVIGAFDGTNASRSIAANTNIYMYSRYILSMDTNQL